MVGKRQTDCHGQECGVQSPTLTQFISLAFDRFSWHQIIETHSLGEEPRTHDTAMPTTGQ